MEEDSECERERERGRGTSHRDSLITQQAAVSLTVSCFLRLCPGRCRFALSPVGYGIPAHQDDGCVRRQRAQSHHCGSGQCRKDHNPLPVPDQGGRPHDANHWQQRGGDHHPEYSLLGVGHWGTGESPGQLVLLLLQHRDCDSGCGQHRPRAAHCKQRGTSPDARTRGPGEGVHPDPGQQARREGLPDGGGDLPVPHPRLHHDTPLACPGLLRPHRRRSTCQSGLDEVTSGGELKRASRLPQTEALPPQRCRSRRFGVVYSV